MDWKLTKWPFGFIGEYASFSLDAGGFENDGVTTVPGYLSGYYLQAKYRFWFDCLKGTFLGKGFEDPHFTLVAGLDRVTIDDDGDPNTNPNQESRETIGLNYRPNETFAFKMEYQFNHTTNESLEHGDLDGFIGSVTAAF